MFTEIYSVEENRNYKFVTQQYEVGLYIIVNNNPELQMTSRLKEEEYHKQLRIKAIKNKDDIVDGTILTYNGKYKINDFKNN